MDFRAAQDLETVMELQQLSSEEFAKNIGVSRMTLNNWLTGKHKISESHLAAFYDYAYKSGIKLNRIKEQLYREDVVSASEVLLFHGAKTEIVGELSFNCSKKNNDFGQGFYCGENLEQSVMFVSNFPNSSLYMVKFNKAGLKCRTFGVTGDWMLMIAYYRNRLGDFANTGIVKELINQNTGIDYIIAPIADNRMFEIIDSFIDGEITDIQCKHCLSATNLGNQYVFVSQASLNQIEILERCYLAQKEKEAYLNSRQEVYEMNRDKVKVARKQYRGQGDYIEDILV